MATFTTIFIATTFDKYLRKTFRVVTASQKRNLWNRNFQETRISCATWTLKKSPVLEEPDHTIKFQVWLWGLRDSRVLCKKWESHWYWIMRKHSCSTPFVSITIHLLCVTQRCLHDESQGRVREFLCVGAHVSKREWRDVQARSAKNSNYFVCESAREDENIQLFLRQVYLSIISPK